MRIQRWRQAAALCIALTASLALGACGGGTEEETAETASVPEAPAAPSPSSGSAGRAGAPAGNVQVDPALAAYPRVGGVSGTLTSVGSDTLNNLMTLWTEEFRKVYPSVRIQVEGKGSSTAPPALIENTAQLGPMSREMKTSEVDAFEKKFGYAPTRIRVAVDALAVYVHQDNPLEQLTLPQVDAIFSRARACGHPRELRTWGDLGGVSARGALAAQPFSLYGRNSASGTYGFFKDKALCKGDFKDIVKEQPGSASVVQGITRDLKGIGYSGIGYRTSGVKILKLANKEGEEFHGTDPESVLAGEYPLSRFLYVYVNQPPGRPLDPLIKQFLTFVLSREGQEVVVRDGYLPVTAAIADEELGKLR